VKNDALFVLASAALAVAERLPLSVLREAGRSLGGLAWALVPGLRQIALENVARAMPQLDEASRGALVRRAYRELGAILGETVATLDPARPIHPLPFLPGSRECLAEAIEEGRGVLFASAHLGPWERVAASLMLAGVPLTVVAREPYDPRLRRVYDRLRAARGLRTVYRGTSGAGTALLRVLRRGGVLGIPMDLASRVPSIDVPFLDVLAPTPVGPARLAIRTGAAVVVGTAAPSPGGSGVGLSFVRLAPATCEEALSASINAELSARIRAFPEAWPWMHRRWPSKEGSPTRGRIR
jgi:KDO2-lipid IV(A) lauroyltransferase